MSRKAAFLILFLVAALVWAEDQSSSAELAFTKLRALAGDWDGTYQWTGARNSSGKMGATYYLSGNDSALVENLSSDGKPSMTSVYHLDGSDLRMTHYCAARNQPRLKADHIDNEKGVFEFSFVDATNLRTPDAPHVTGLKLETIDANHLQLTFLFEGGGKQSQEHIALTRVASVTK